MNGNEIRQARERAGLTQGELGERVGVSGRTVGNWERDFSIPRNKLAKVEQVLNVREYLGSESKLQDVSDASLLAEIARRFDEGRTREKAGEGSEHSATSNRQAAGSAATEKDMYGLAADMGGESEGERLAREADALGEEPQD